MLSSPPVWSILVAEFAHSWTMFLLLIAQGRFFKDIFNLAVYQNPILQALPLLMLTILVPLGGQARSFFMLMFFPTCQITCQRVEKLQFCFLPSGGGLPLPQANPVHNCCQESLQQRRPLRPGRPHPGGRLLDEHHGGCHGAGGGDGILGNSNVGVPREQSGDFELR